MLGEAPAAAAVSRLADVFRHLRNLFSVQENKLFMQKKALKMNQHVAMNAVIKDVANVKAEKNSVRCIL